jgi:CBL proto-oncogene N-terminus, EF hand-like domain/SH2 domain
MAPKVLCDDEAQKFWTSVSSTSSNSCSWSSFVTKCEACAEFQQLPVKRVLEHTVHRAALDTVTLNEFGTFIRRFGPFKACLKKACAVFDTTWQLAPWYHGAASREDCLRRLRTAGAAGYFLVRCTSSRPECFNVMVQQGNVISDSLLRNSGAAGYCHDDPRDVKDTWATLAGFVQHYQDVGLLTRPLPELMTEEDTFKSLVMEAELSIELAKAVSLSPEQRATHSDYALQLLQSALVAAKAAEAAGKPDALTQCKALGLMGGLLLSNGQHSEAVAPYKQALAVLGKHVGALEHSEDESCGDHSTHAFRLHAELTTCYLASGDSENSTTALQHYAEMMASVPHTESHTECRLKHAKSWREHHPRFADVVQQVQFERIEVSVTIHTITPTYYYQYTL